VHVPAASIVAVEPDTEQTEAVLELNVTASPELALAESASFAPTVCVPVIAGKVIVWLCRTTKLVPTAGAAA